MKYILTTLVLLLSACSIKNYAHSDAKLIILKTKKLKFADLGYVRHSDDAVELELFVAGKVVQKIAINHLVCVDEGCMSRLSFNAEYLDESYPADLLQNVVLGKHIYKGKNLLSLNGNFEQNIESENVDIFYKVSAKEIFFKDRKNRIIIKLKDLK